MTGKQVELLQRVALGKPLTAETGLRPPANWVDKLGRSEISLAVVKDQAHFRGMPMWRAELKRPSATSDIPIEPVLWGSQEMGARQAQLLEFLAGVGREKRTRVYLTRHSLVIVRECNGTEWEALDSEPFHLADPLEPDVPTHVLVEWELETPPAAQACVAMARGAYEPCNQCYGDLARKGLESERQRVKREKAEADRERLAYEHFITTPAGKRWLKEYDAEARARGDY